MRLAKKQSIVAMSLCSVMLSGASTGAQVTENVARHGVHVFASHCFSPFMTGAKAAAIFDADALRYDFYDLDPFSSAAPSPVTGRAATQGTDRRCEIAFDGDFRQQAATATINALKAEGILTKADLPSTHTEIEGTQLLAARHLNPKRIAVVHVGLRPGPNGDETFLLVERLVPANDQN